MRIFQEEIFGPVLGVTTFKDFDEAMEIANDTEYGLGAGVWSRSGDTAYRAGRAIKLVVYGLIRITNTQLVLHLVASNFQVSAVKIMR